MGHRDNRKSFEKRSGMPNNKFNQRISKTLKKDNLTGDIRKLGFKLAKNKTAKPEELYMFQHLMNHTSVDIQSAENVEEGQIVIEAALSGQKDNSRKAYYREFKKVIDQADVILEILDARDPLGCRSKDVEEMIMNAGASKKIILVLNKIGNHI